MANEVGTWHGSPALDGAQDALNKMRRAYERGTGCRLTADEIQSLGLTSIGQCWDQDDPRTEKHTRHPDWGWDDLSGGRNG